MIYAPGELIEYTRATGETVQGEFHHLENKNQVYAYWDGSTKPLWASLSKVRRVNEYDLEPIE